MLSVNTTPQLSQRPQSRQMSQPAFKGAESYLGMHYVLVKQMPKDVSSGGIDALITLGKLKEYLSKQMEPVGLKISEGNIFERLFNGLERLLTGSADVKVVDTKNQVVGKLDLVAGEGIQQATYLDGNGKNVKFSKAAMIWGPEVFSRARPPIADDVLEKTVNRTRIHDGHTGHLTQVDDRDANDVILSTKKFRPDGTLESLLKGGEITHYEDDGITPIAKEVLA